MAEDQTLPGWPKKKLVKDVRRHLAHYGIRPTCPRAWRTTWIWAEAIARSYWQTRWPLASEIATQYILLLLAEMKKSHMLHLPYRADTVLPAEAAAALLDIQGSGLLAIGREDRSSKPRNRRIATGPRPAIQMAAATHVKRWPVHQPDPNNPVFGDNYIYGINTAR